MRRAVRRVVILLFAAVSVLAAGCSVNSNFVYKPNPPVAGERKLPVKAAVLPFTDGTENFTKRGSMLGDGQFNLAKVGVGGTISAMTPEFWGKSFADELSASGSFRSARFVFSPSELQDEDVVIDGTLKKVIYAATFDYANQLLVSFRATRRSDKAVVWEKEIGRVWKTPRSVNAGCGMGVQCVIDKMHADWNKWMGGVLAEARMDLVTALSALSDGGAGSGAGAITAGPSAGESVEQTIDKILKSK